ncbi:MAG: hypothetical protein IJU91_05890 [Selenomonadaceae bacterium]|nr:hypothetical protein [Selenomonadaceae bacterium]
MLKKSFAVFMAAFLIIFAAGCGNDKPKISADKSIAAWTELYATGTSSHLTDAGIPADSEKEVADTLNKIIGDQFKEFPLSDSNVEEATKYYLNHLKNITKVQTSLKKDDAKNPVVEVKATMIDNNVTEDMNKLIQENEGIKALMELVQKATAMGQNIDDMKKDAAVQNIALESIKLFIDNLPTTERTLDVTCTLGKGDDGKTLYWMPEDPEKLAVFAQGR